MIKTIERDNKGMIIPECIDSMIASLPIKVYVNDDIQSHRTLHNKKEFDAYFNGALPYCLTTRYEQENS